MNERASPLSADTKDALARDVPATAAERAALRLGLVRFGAVGERFRTPRLAVARLLMRLLDRPEDAEPRESRIERRERRALALGAEFVVTLPPEIAAADHGATAAAVRPRRAERRLELRGAFLAAGSVAEPARGYHLEFTVRTAPLADRLAALVRAEGPEPGRLIRRGRHVVYVKGVDGIVAVLGALGAYGAVFRLEETRAVKETKNRIRRLVNTEAANVDRAAGAAAAQRERIAFLADAYGLGNLTPPLREVAELRLAHPSETLAELGRLCDPQVSKSTVNGRIAGLLRLADRLAGRSAPAAEAATSGCDVGPKGSSRSMLR